MKQFGIRMEYYCIRVLCVIGFGEKQEKDLYFNYVPDSYELKKIVGHMGGIYYETISVMQRCARVGIGLNGNVWMERG